MDIWTRTDRPRTADHSNLAALVMSDPRVPLLSASRNHTRMQLLTETNSGAKDPMLYNLPAHILVPIQPLSIPTAWLWSCRREIRTIHAHAAASSRAAQRWTTASAGSAGASFTLSRPSDVDAVLTHWYGATWREPRRFDKGTDYSEDALEVALWSHAATLYELFWSGKVLARLLVYGALYHPSKLAWYVALQLTASVLCHRAITTGRQRATAEMASKQQHRAVERWEAAGTALCAGLYATTYLLVLHVALWMLSEEWQWELGPSQWRGAIGGVAVAYGLRKCWERSSR